MRHRSVFYALFIVIITGCGGLDQRTESKYAGAINESKRLMDSLLQTERTPGMDIAVSLHGQVVWSKGFGYADLENMQPVIAGETRFRIGSVSKPLTAAAVGRLIDKDKMNVEEVVQTYVPYFPIKKFPVTVAQIGGHIGGIRHYKNEEFLMAKHFESVEEGIEIFKADPLLFEPGTRFSYSSYGFNLLSAAVEGAGGEKFLDLMQEEVFDPLEMYSTCEDLNDSIILHRASFYELNEDGIFVNAPYVDNSYKWAGGGFISTTTDLIRFGEAHMKPGYLSKNALKILTTSQKLNNGDDTGYGIGWFTSEIDRSRRYGHGGGSIGGITDFAIYPDEELVIAILSNSSDTKYGNVLEQIVGFFLEADKGR